MAIQNLGPFFIVIMILKANERNRSLNRGWAFVTVRYYIRILKSCTKKSKMDQIIVAALGHTSKQIAKNDGGRSGDENSRHFEKLITLI